MRSSKTKLVYNMIIYWIDVNRVLFKPERDLL